MTENHQISNFWKSTKWFSTTKVSSHQSFQPPNSSILGFPPNLDTVLKEISNFSHSEGQIPPNCRTTGIPPNSFQSPRFSTTKVFSTKVSNHQGFHHQSFPIQGNWSLSGFRAACLPPPRVADGEWCPSPSRAGGTGDRIGHTTQ